MAKIKVVHNVNTRAPLVRSRGTGLNANHAPKQAAVAVVNPFARSTK